MTSGLFVRLNYLWGRYFLFAKISYFNKGAFFSTFRSI